MIAVTSAGLLLILGGVPAVAMAADTPLITDSTCQGADLNLADDASSNTCKTSTADAGDNANTLVARVINIFSVIVGVVCVIMIIYGGFRYVTSGGESGNISTAKNTILYAIIGLVIVALAQFIVKFVLAKATGNS